MALRKHLTFENAKGDSAIIYRDSVWQEFRVRFSYAGTGPVPEADYHTQDESDAVSTAKNQLGMK